jgi:hypothetical protein
MRTVPRKGFHLKVAAVLVVTAGGFTVSLAPGRADAAAENSKMAPVAPTAARRRTFRRTSSAKP